MSLGKVTIFGAGHVGATTAFYLALFEDVDVALVDIEEGKPEGIALDMGQALPFTGSSSRISGGCNPEVVEGSDLVIVTAGSPRLPGMSRLDLMGRNAPVVREIARETARLAPGAVVIVVTNPVDEMTFFAWEAGGFPAASVMGMAGVLDTSRFLYFVDELAPKLPAEVNAMVLGTHGDDMVPLIDWSNCGGVPLSEVMEPGVLDACVERTRLGGAEVVSKLKTGSAYYAPAVSLGVMAGAVLADSGRVLPVSAYLDGHYGISGVFIGVPARLGRKGVLEVLELPLSATESEALRDAAEAVRARTDSLGEAGGDVGN